MMVGIASLAKTNNAGQASAVLAGARDIIGGNGVHPGYRVARYPAGVQTACTSCCGTTPAPIVGHGMMGYGAFS